MSNRDMSEEVYSSSDDEKYFDEDINYSQYPDRDAGFNIQSTTTKLVTRRVLSLSLMSLPTLAPNKKMDQLLTERSVLLV